jgi:hypothetical protein
MTSPEKKVVHRVGKPTLYERAIGRYSHIIGGKQSACGRDAGPVPDKEICSIHASIEQMVPPSTP